MENMTKTNHIKKESIVKIKNSSKFKDKLFKVISIDDTHNGRLYNLLPLDYTKNIIIYENENLEFVANTLEDYENIQKKLGENNMNEIKIGNILKDKNNNLYQLVWFSKDQIYELMRLKNSSIIRLYNIDEFYYVSESIEKYNHRLKKARKNNMTKMEISTNKESNNYPDRYDGDKCMIVIEEFPVKDANENTAGAMFCIGSIIKYLWRLERKGDPLDQIDKIEWYVKRLKSYYIKNKQNEINESIVFYEE